jgi:hypothetical protein
VIEKELVTAEKVVKQQAPQAARARQDYEFYERLVKEFQVTTSMRAQIMR